MFLRRFGSSSQVDRLMAEKQASERAALRQKMAEMAERAGMSLDALFGRGARVREAWHRCTWTDRGRMPLWMVAATKGAIGRQSVGWIWFPSEEVELPDCP
jgi:hypothetical protein